MRLILEIRGTPGQTFLWEDEYPFQCLIGGFGSGKSYGFVIKALLSAFRHWIKTGNYSSWLLSEPTHNMCLDVLMPLIDEVCLDYGFEWEWQSKSEMKVKVYFWGISTILYIRSAENYIRWRGIQGSPKFPLSGGGLDEAALLKDANAWKMLLSRTRKCKEPVCWITSNPPDPTLRFMISSVEWIYNMWEDKKNIDRGYALYRASTLENIFLPDVKGYVKMLREELGESLSAIYVDGQKASFSSGRLFYSFDEDKHCLLQAPFPLQPKLEDLYLVYDFNLNPMTAFVCYYKKESLRSKRKTLFIDKEYIIADSTARGLTYLIADDYKHHLGQIKVTGDPAGRNRSTTGEMIIKEDKNLYSSKHNFQIIDEELNKVFESDQIEFFYSMKSGMIGDLAEDVNRAFDLGVLKINPQCKGVINDLKTAPMKRMDYNIWKRQGNKNSHGSDKLRYIVHDLMPLNMTKIRTGYNFR